MKKSLTRLVAILALSTASLTSADLRATDSTCAYESGLWSLSVHGAYAPSVFNEDLKFTSALADVRGGSVTIPSGESAVTQANLIKRTASFKFSDHYEHPFRFGGDVSYFFRNFTEVFLGVDFYVMRGKNFDLFGQTLNGNRIAIQGKVSPNNRLAIFAGARHFFDVCSWYYPYLGFKVGVVKHTGKDKDNREDINYRVLNGANIDGMTQYMVNGARGIVGLYGGLHAGIDIPLICIDPCMKNTSFYLGVEAVGHGAIEYDLPVKRINKNNGGFQLTHEVTQAPRTFMSFPFTAGLKIRF